MFVSRVSLRESLNVLKRAMLMFCKIKLVLVLEELVSLHMKFV